MAVSSYAFDDFGRNIDPRTGKQRKHDYTTNGNIIQPFAFTGYQEDEVSGLKFAQARFYNASTGRFQSEDNVKGFINVPFTLNHYGYCWGNPVCFEDCNGNLPKLLSKVANFADEHPFVAGAACIGVAVAAVVAAPAIAGAAAAGTISAAVGTAATLGLSAVGAAATDLGLQVMQKGSDVNWAEVGIAGAAGLVTGGISLGCSALGTAAAKAESVGLKVAIETVRGVVNVGGNMLTAGGESYVVSKLEGHSNQEAKNKAIKTAKIAFGFGMFDEVANIGSKIYQNAAQNDVLKDITESEGVQKALRRWGSEGPRKSIIKELQKAYENAGELMEFAGIKAATEVDILKAIPFGIYPSIVDEMCGE